MPSTRIIVEPDLPFVEIIREFDAPRDLVYRAYTEPELLAQWMGPRRLAMRIDRFDRRDGGSWQFVHTDADGHEYGFRGVFHGTPTPDAMVRTFEFEGWPGRVSLERLTFDEHDGRTVTHALSVFQSVADRDATVASGMEPGVVEGMERLDELLARMTRPN